jgi:hypothetical protein
MKPFLPRPVRRPRKGVAAVEFALLALGFFIVLFGVLEIARAVYLINTLQEVTRRAASLAASSRFDSATLDQIRQQALFGSTNGSLLLGDPVTTADVKIDYLSMTRDATTGTLSAQPASPMPSCPATNRVNCLADPYSASCIRMVRVRICDPNGPDDCTRVGYRMLFPLINLSGLKLPQSETLAPAQSLGYTAGSVPCP